MNEFCDERFSDYFSCVRVWPPNRSGSSPAALDMPSPATPPDDRAESISIKMAAGSPTLRQSTGTIDSKVATGHPGSGRDHHQTSAAAADIGQSSATPALVFISLHRFGAVCLVVLVPAQAVIAGQHIFGDWGIGVHAALGNAGFTIAALMVAIAWAKLNRRPLRIVAIAIVVLMAAQIGLGYSARSSESAAALHVPLGVAVFGAVVYQLLVAWPALLGQTTTVGEPSPKGR